MQYIHISGLVFVGTGVDEKLYTKSYSDKKWDGPFDTTCCMVRIAFMQDGSLLGVGEDQLLYTKTSFDSGSWEVVEDSCCIQDVTVKHDGTIIGISNEPKLMSRTDLSRQWTTILKFNDAIRIDVLPDDNLLGVTADGELKRREGGIFGNWVWEKTVGMKAEDISIQPDGTVLGIEKGGCGVHVLDLETGVWGEELPESQCVTAIASPGNLIFPVLMENTVTDAPPNVSFRSDLRCGAGYVAPNGADPAEYCLLFNGLYMVAILLSMSKKTMLEHLTLEYLTIFFR
uniref:Uncharacterized protein LOC102805741 n=1 Tax=Saccoglossus kowalevskii TaxID=10224 RepID=A0ABM0MQB7_SACKO|nr:PREDICTED: uncharacterized protein LOC102805741 [Saccoglossus kowalevskii]